MWDGAGMVLVCLSYATPATGTGWEAVGGQGMTGRIRDLRGFGYGEKKKDESEKDIQVRWWGGRCPDMHGGFVNQRWSLAHTPSLQAGASPGWRWTVGKNLGEGAGR